MTPVPIDPRGGGGGYSISVTLTVDSGSMAQIGAAMKAALGAGATSVNAYGGKGSGPGAPPDATTLAPGIEAATKQAQLMAQASAKAAGVKLRTVRSVNVAAPISNYGAGGPSAMGWQVAVTVTYNLAP
jgi:uncharacterized protein YggE